MKKTQQKPTAAEQEDATIRLHFDATVRNWFSLRNAAFVQSQTFNNMPVAIAMYRRSMRLLMAMPSYSPTDLADILSDLAVCVTDKAEKSALHNQAVEIYAKKQKPLFVIYDRAIRHFHETGNAKRAVQLVNQFTVDAVRTENQICINAARQWMFDICPRKTA